jgi:tyrosyl-tRNA synthetase
MLERREFKSRFESGKPIAVHEFLYPLAQAYDSVFLRADVELGGTDQLFNLNVGRDIMPSYDLEPQVVMTTPVLEGLDGVEKMSKSLGNYVGVTETPSEMFGKVMSISDELMWKYYTLLTDLSPPEVLSLRTQVGAGALHPKQAKIDLAKRIVRDFHSPQDAERAADEFERVFSRGERPAPSRTIRLRRGTETERLTLAKLLADNGLATSGSDAARKIKERAVSYEGTTSAGAELPKTLVTQPTYLIGNLERGEYLLRVGRQTVALVINGNG